MGDLPRAYRGELARTEYISTEPAQCIGGAAEAKGYSSHFTFSASTRHSDIPNIHTGLYYHPRLHVSE